jgi:hypothetical protein
VKNPKIHKNLRALDFGAGFYLTSDKLQATKWAKVVTKRRQIGYATLIAPTTKYCATRRSFCQTALLPKALRTTSMRGFGVAHFDKNPRRFTAMFNCRSNNVYEIDDGKLKDLKMLKFEVANADWLDFVVNNRKEQIVENLYDIVIGPVANDATLPVIDDYMDGVYTKDEAVKRLMPQNLTDQYAFLTDVSLKLLAFKRSEQI